VTWYNYYNLQEIFSQVDGVRRKGRVNSYEANEPISIDIKQQKGQLIFLLETNTLGWYFTGLGASI
jgi:hypothetical protein